jgi:2-polyprenyl-6-methoxyphenol hydroxylase-like FAD-dependent oxidoreductase
MERVDFVLIGSGIAGSALARALASAGRRVLVLERETEYRDRVRGECIQPWGVLEAQALDIESILLGAGGHYTRRSVSYDDVFTPAEAEQRTVRTDRIARGCAGVLDVGHPQACAALSAAAEAAGATVLRGVKNVRVRAGRSPAVTFVHAGIEHDVPCGLVVGADGRNSTVREQLGLALEETEVRVVGAGLLVRNAGDWPDDLSTFCSDTDRYTFVLPRADGIVRLYVLWSADDRTRFAGDAGTRRFLECFDSKSLPHGPALARAEPAGPCATHPMNDSHVDEPMLDGAVLMGDAAGWNDPIIGQGISIALRDARILRDILLGSDGPPSRDALVPYAEERRERLRRLRFAAQCFSNIRCTFGTEGRARRRRWFDSMAHDSLIRAAARAPYVGPHESPEEAFTDDAWAHFLSL